MDFAPTNAPHAIVVGAIDDKGTRDTSDDSVATFSSYGVTQDGFSKPDLVAPSRHLVSTLASKLAPLADEFPNNVTSF
jgi:serine protease AprX